MGVIYEVDPGHPDQAALEAAGDAIAAGSLVILPTETVYGLASRPDMPEATARLFEAKGRPTALSLPVLAPTAEAAWQLGRPSQRARRLAASFWPGPLTMALHRTGLTAGWPLGEHADTIAIRVPEHRLTGELLQLTGPLAATSANPSGQPPLADPHELQAAFDTHVSVFLVLRPGEPQPMGVASTVVDCTRSAVRVVREGTVTREQLMQVLGSDLRLHPNG